MNERWINSFRVPHATWTYGLGTKEHLVSTKQGQCTSQRLDEKGKPDFDEVADHAQSIAISLFFYLPTCEDKKMLSCRHCRGCCEVNLEAVARSI